MQLCEVQKMKDISMIKDKTNERREYQMSASMFQLLRIAIYRMTPG